MGMTLGREQLFHRILVFFAVFTAFTGVLNMCSTDAITLETLGSAGGTIPGQVVIDTSAYNPSQTTQTTITDINFTTSGYSELYETRGYGTWTNSSSGLTLTNVGILNLISSVDPAVVLKNVVGNDNVYSVSYLVDNVPNQEFYLFPRYYVGDSVLARDNIRIRVAGDGIHITEWDTGGYWKDYYFYPLSNAQSTIPGGSTYRTVLYEDVTDTAGAHNAHIEFYKDGVQYFYVDCLSTTSTLRASGYTHGGAGSESVGFILKGFPSTTVTANYNETGAGTTGIAWLDGIISGVSTFISMVTAFFGSLGAILGLSQDALIPFWLWAIVAVPCIITLGYMMIESITEAVP